MTRARAPGKIVLSGAYAVLSGAPALVAAVDRYVTADSARSAGLVTPEVARAVPGPHKPWFEAEALRENGQKLGLGSSAAIVVASLAALELEQRPGLDDADLCHAVYQPALIAHRAAQGGGSGVDIAASAHGGVIAARRREGGELALTKLDLPDGLHFEVWACSAAASTAAFLARIAEFAARDPDLHGRCMGAQAEAARAAHDAALRNHGSDFVVAIARQVETLSALGAAAGVPIVTPEHAQLATLAASHGAAFLPAGAGGGDVAYYVGARPPTADFAGRARELGLTALDLRLGARGVHAL